MNDERKTIYPKDPFLMQKNIGNGSFFLFTLARKQYIISCN